MQDKLVHVSIPLSYKAEDDLVVGYANKAVVDDGGDYIPPEVWFEALQAFFREGMPIKLLHRPRLIVGETVWLKIDAQGLQLASRPLYPEIKGLIDRGLLTAYSIGYRPKEWKDRAGGGRDLLQLDLVEVSYVDDPMNKGCFFGGKIMPFRETHEVRFDPRTGTVLVTGLNTEEMAALAELIKQGLVAAGIEDITGIKSIEFKQAEPDRNETEGKAEWTTAYVNDLPDSSFAVIEPAYQRGETNDKRCRHLPHHGPGGGGTKNVNLDLPHLRNALARANQIEPVTNSISTEELRRRAVEHLENHRSALEGGEESREAMKLLSKIWDYIRRKQESNQEEKTNMPQDETKQPVPPAPPTEERESEVDVKAALTELEKQVKAAAEIAAARDKEIAEIKQSLTKLVEIVRDIIPPQTSLPVTDTAGGTERKSKWGLFK